MRKNICILTLLFIFVTGCATYGPVRIDEKTGLYKTSTVLKAGAIQKRDTDVNLKKFRFVYLVANSNIYHGRFEFFVRSALARNGFKYVLNKDELTKMITANPKLSSIQSIDDPVSLKRLSDLVGPIMRVDFKSQWDGDVSRYITLAITDLSNNNLLLKIYHPKFIWGDVDSEAHYPVLNEIKKWIDDSSAGGTRKSI
jgi:hypothetical protein